MKKIFLFLLMAVSINGFSQLVQTNNSYGMGFKRIGADTLLWMPSDTLRPPADVINKSHVARKGTTVYYWDGVKWVAISGGAGSTNTSLGTGYKLAVDATNNVKSIRGANVIRLDTFSATGEIRARWYGALDTNTRVNGADTYKTVFDAMPDGTSDTAFAVNTNGGMGISFTPTPPNKNFSNPITNRYVFKVDARNLTEGIGGFFGDDFGVTTLDMYNFYDSVAHGSGSPGYGGAASSINVGFKNSNENLVMELISAPRRSIYSDSGQAILFNGRNLDIASFGANNSNIRFGKWNNGLTVEWGRVNSVNGYWGFGTPTPTERVTVNGQVRINAISNVGTPDSALYIENGVIKAGLAATPGIDDVLAVGQALTATRNIDATGQVFSISGVLAGVTVDGTSQDVTIQAGDRLTLDAEDIMIPNLDDDFHDTTNSKILVRHETTGKVYRTFWPAFGGSGITTMTAFGSAPNANAGTISGSNLTLQPADGTNPGGISLSAQTMGDGRKTFLKQAVFPNGLSITGARTNADGFVLEYVGGNTSTITSYNGGYQDFQLYANNMHFYGNGANPVSISSGGNLGVGIVAASTAAKLHVVNTTEQIRSAYDASNYLSITTGSTGNTTFDLVGTSPAFTFNKQFTATKQASFNDDGEALNFRVESDNNQNMFLVDGVNDRVGVGVAAGNPNSRLHVDGSFATAYRAITALRTLDVTDHTIEVTSGTFTITLPTAVGITGRQYVITNSGSGVVTIATTSSQTFINVTATPMTLTLNQFSTVTVVANGAVWLRTSSL